MHRITFQSLLLAIFITSTAFAADPQDVERLLKEFHANPAKALQAPLPKWSSDGTVLHTSKFSLGPEELAEVLAERKAMRMEICRRAKRGCERNPVGRDRSYAGFGDSDRIDGILSGMEVIQRLSEMEKRSLTRAKLPVVPWSDSYWPTKSGGVARRYADARFPTNDFEASYAYYLQYPSLSVDTSLLSPAEKYDILVGDSGFGLTKRNWRNGLDTLKERGRVAGWIGLCHGWAPAAYIEKEAKRDVRVRAANGQMLTFHPSDVHALASSLWSEALLNNQYVLVGNVCSIPNPQRDEIGRVIDPKCFSTNPGTWHLTVVNRIGVSRIGFVMDATYDFEVWNQPVYAYQYSYFNPRTLEVSDELFGSMVGIESFRSDKFKAYRSPLARYVVGIAMDVTYVDEIQPSPRARGGRQSLKTVRYIYDLELDRDYKIVGGEWYTNRHPDFLWAPLQGTRPVSEGEIQLNIQSDWSGRDVIPEELRRAALISSQKGQPISAVVRALIERSQGEE